jgi:hypothetical protein
MVKKQWQTADILLRLLRHTPAWPFISTNTHAPELEISMSRGKISSQK